MANKKQKKQKVKRAQHSNRSGLGRRAARKFRITRGQLITGVIGLGISLVESGVYDLLKNAAGICNFLTQRHATILRREAAKVDHSLSRDLGGLQEALKRVTAAIGVAQAASEVGDDTKTEIFDYSDNNSLFKALLVAIREGKNQGSELFLVDKLSRVLPQKARVKRNKI